MKPNWKLAVDGATDNANDIASQLVNGQVDANAGLTALDDINTAFGFSGSAASQSGGTDTQSTSDMVNLLNSAGNLINSLEASGNQLLDVTLPGDDASQEQQVNTAVASIASNLIDNLGGVDANGDVQGDDLTAEDAQSIANAMGTVLSGLNAVSSEISQEVVTQVRELVKVLGDKADTSIIERYLSSSSSTTVSSAIQGGGAAGSHTANAFVKNLGVSMTPISDSIKPVNLSTTVRPNDSFFTNPFGNNLKRVLTDSSPMGETIEGGISGSTVRIDDESPLVEIAVGGEFFATEIPDVRIVSTEIPEGVSVLPDGSAAVISDQFAFIVTPSSRDLGSFVNALNTDFAATVSVNSASGGYILENAELKASVSFAFESFATSTTAAVGPVTINEPPVSNPADPAFNYSVSYSDGTTQSLAPFVAEEDFFEALVETGVLATIDRSTGVVDMGDGLFLKPDYVLTDLNDFQMQLVENEGGSLGVVIGSAGDVNGDGLADTIVLSDKGAQILFRIP